jgi:signal recognition particle subunit SEC65
MRELTVTRDAFPLLVQSRGIAAPIAIKVATDKSEEEIMTAITEVKENPRKGLSPTEIKKALRKLGLKVKDVSKMAEKDEPKGETRLGKHITENEFLKHAQEGHTYILTNRNHTWTVKGKEVIDPVWVVPNPQGSRRRIESIIEVIGEGEKTA